MAGSTATRQSRPSTPAPTCWSQAPRFSKRAAKAAHIMPAISLASADDLNHADDLPVGRYAHVRKPSPMALVPEAARIAIASGLDDVMSLVRQTWFYRQTLTGTVPARIHAYTDDYRTRVLQDAD